jgi:hypothetical protein
MEILEENKYNDYLNYAKCLQASIYTIFSNLNSVHEWNTDSKNPFSWSIERPHNDMHVAIGGSARGAPDADFDQLASGDMGENETAAFDPAIRNRTKEIQVTYDCSIMFASTGEKLSDFDISHPERMASATYSWHG